MTDLSSESGRIARMFLDHTFAGRTDEAIAMLSPDLVWQVMGPAGGLKVSGRHNRDKAERILRGMAKVLPDGLNHRIIGMTAQDERVAIEAEAEGIWLDGRIYRNAYHFLIRVTGGQIVEVKEYMDTLAVFRMEHPGLSV